jgi:hypothetical protein
MFTLEALKALLRHIYGQLLDNTTSAGRSSWDGDRSMSPIQAAVLRIAEGAMGWEECRIAILYSQ